MAELDGSAALEVLCDEIADSLTFLGRSRK